MFIIKKKTNIYIKYLIILIITMATGLTTTWFYNRKTSVTFVGLQDYVKYQIDHKNELLFTKTGYYGFKSPLNIIPPGQHLIHYDVSKITRYYAPVNIKKGENYIKPVFSYHSLPALSIHGSFALNKNKHEKREKEFTYKTYTDNNTEKDNTVNISLGLKINQFPDNGKVLVYEYEWDIFLNGALIGKDRFVQKGHISDEARHGKKIILYEDASHRYYADYYFIKGATRLKIGSEYL